MVSHCLELLLDMFSQEITVDPMFNLCALGTYVLCVCSLYTAIMVHHHASLLTQQ
jgi:hypothetical protein